MGRAIVRDPKVFLFDEPLSNLDAKLRVAMRAEIKALHQRLKTTTVYVTHDQVEAMTMADRIVVMHDGRIEQIGTPLELYDRPGTSSSRSSSLRGDECRRRQQCGEVFLSAGAAHVEAGGRAVRWPLPPGARVADRQAVYRVRHSSPSTWRSGRNGGGDPGRDRPSSSRRVPRRSSVRSGRRRCAHRPADSRAAERSMRETRSRSRSTPVERARVRQDVGPAAEELGLVPRTAHHSDPERSGHGRVQRAEVAYLPGFSAHVRRRG
jgi:energy-coupling factor transporter ATP-binding protein EcfA2